MARPSNGPRCPTQEEIDNLVDVINPFIELCLQGSNEPQPKCPEAAKDLERLIEILDWAGEQVSKRRLYSKKFQLKDKERTRILKEKLGDEYSNVLDEAKRQASARLSEEVVSGEPDQDDLQLIKRLNSQD